jgi:hypothetical protein
MSSVVRKTARISASKTASKASSGAKTRFKTPSVTKTIAKAGAERKLVIKKAASHILSPPRGARTLTHREIRQAVERVFEERYSKDA